MLIKRLRLEPNINRTNFELAAIISIITPFEKRDISGFVVAENGRGLRVGRMRVRGVGPRCVILFRSSNNHSRLMITRLRG